MQLMIQRLPADCQSRQQHIAAYALLSDALFGAAGIRTARILREEMGKPYLLGTDLQFSLSHCKGMAVCALGDHTPIGVDCEALRTVRPRVAKRCFSDSELRQLEQSDQPDLLFTRLWTLKESFVKAIGRGISYPMKSISFKLCDDCITASDSTFSFSQILTEDGFVISVCHKDADGKCRNTGGAGEITVVSL